MSAAFRTRLRHGNGVTQCGSSPDKIGHNFAPS